jgi:uncharacterized protein (DUF433 family)
MMSEALGKNGISCDPEILGGKPEIAETRISVELILSKLAAGRPKEEILYSHSLPPEAIDNAIALRPKPTTRPSSSSTTTGVPCSS